MLASIFYKQPAVLIVIESRPFGVESVWLFSPSSEFTTSGSIHVNLTFIACCLYISKSLIVSFVNILFRKMLCLQDKACTKSLQWKKNDKNKKHFYIPVTVS